MSGGLLLKEWTDESVWNECALHENQLSKTCVIGAITCLGLADLHSDGVEGSGQRTVISPFFS